MIFSIEMNRRTVFPCPQLEKGRVFRGDVFYLQQGESFALGCYVIINFWP